MTNDRWSLIWLKGVLAGTSTLSLLVGFSSPGNTTEQPVNASPSSKVVSVVPVSTDSTQPRATDQASRPSRFDQIAELAGDPSLSNSPDKNPKDPLAQASPVTSVAQLSDVRPTDWAFQALQSLVERYGCLAGYPDKTYRGNRALTRYEFAAGLNACLDRVNELIASSNAERVHQEDLNTLRKLQEQFAAELATLRGRVDALEAKTATLQKQQFSTTTKLSGEAIFVAGGVLSGDRADGKPADKVPTLQDRVRLILSSSFTGKDSLRLILTAGNIAQLGSFVSTTRGNPPINTFTGALGTYDGLLADATPPRYSPNGLYLTTATYRLPLSDSTTLNVFAQSEGVFALGLSSVINPYLESGGGNHSITRFGRRNAVYDYGDSGPGAALIQKVGKQLELGVAYTAVNGDNPASGNGLFNGRYVLAGQATYYSVDRRFRAAFTYVNTYSPAGTPFGTQVGSNLSNSTTGTGASANVYGLGLFYQINPKIALNGWVGYGQQHYFKSGNGEVWNWALGLALPDLFSKGSLGGLLVGMEPKLTYLDKTVNLGAGFGKADRNTSLHIEAFYQYHINDHIEITPGVVWITAPNFDARNSDDVIALVRTTFKF